MVISGCLLLHFAQIDHAKTSSFCSFQDNNLKIAAQFPLKKNNKSMVFATLSQKRCLKKQTQKHGFSKTPKLPVVDESLANYKHSWTWSKKPPENKRHTPRGGRRTCYLVVVVVVVVLAIVSVMLLLLLLSSLAPRFFFFILRLMLCVLFAVTSIIIILSRRFSFS